MRTRRAQPQVLQNRTQASWRGSSVALISLLVASVTAQALALVSAISPWFAWLHSLVVEE
ncbi:hypothetical protein F0U61_10705 [Archangium violaceum]|uniref:hypothetical protein n=1 Tax=Archangium violaceum TaxID=83451 RepID=UPI002B2B613C|nr:hypothetical protein F0U61_10705 [Archangium violaceum]